MIGEDVSLFCAYVCGQSIAVHTHTDCAEVGRNVCGERKDTKSKILEFGKELIS